MKTASLLLVKLALFSIAGFAQRNIGTYTVKSIDGINQKISLRDGELESETLTISCGNNKLVITNYWALEKVNIVKGHFLEIKYAQRGGSCVGIGRTLWLCTNKGKFVVPFAVMDKLTGCGAGEDDSYTIKTNLIEKKGVVNTIDFYIHDKKIITNPKLGAGYNKRWLNHSEYNSSYNIFQNGHQTLSGNFTVTSAGYPFKTSKEYFDGNFPIISIKGPNLTTSTYFYIKNVWYEQGEKNHLIKAY